MVELPQLSESEMMLRIGLALVCGAVVGFEREWRDRAAGLRTHMLVCVGSAVFMIVSAYGFNEWGELLGINSQTRVVADPARIAAQVVSGIGFLGAGVIWKNQGETQGLTTAATLWAMASVGMAAGLGLYWLTGITTLTILFTLLVLRAVGYWVKDQKAQEDIELKIRIANAEVLKEVNTVTEEYGDIQYTKVGMADDEGIKTVIFTITNRCKEARDLIADVSTINGVHSVIISDDL